MDNSNSCELTFSVFGGFNFLLVHILIAQFTQLAVVRHQSGMDWKINFCPIRKNPDGGDEKLSQCSAANSTILEVIDET